MNVALPSIESLITWPTYTRNKSGDYFTDISSVAEWTGNLSNLKLAENHPILTPAILFVAKLFSQAEFTVERVSTKKPFEGHPFLELIQNPNPYQTQQDFLETLMFMQIAQGVAVVYMDRVIGFDEPENIYVLNKDNIQWPVDIINKGFIGNSDNIMNAGFSYKDGNGTLRGKIKDLLFFYDLPNGTKNNPFDVQSRIDGLKQTLINTKDSLIAKNIILKSNGKEMVTTVKDGFPLGGDEKDRIEEEFSQNYGLGFNRRRGIVTNATLNWKSLHIALRDLGLDESTKVDGNIVYTALHIPKDILSLEAKKTTYNNFKESMVSYLQNEMQSSLNAFLSVFQKVYSDKYKIKGSYEHMPIMQFILIERYDGIKKRGEALNTLLRTGIPDEVALEMCGFEKSLKLKQLMQLENNGQEQNGNQGNNQGEDNEEED